MTERQPLTVQEELADFQQLHSRGVMHDTFCNCWMHQPDHPRFIEANRLLDAEERRLSPPTLDSTLAARLRVVLGGHRSREGWICACGWMPPRLTGRPTADWIDHVLAVLESPDA